MQGGCAAVFGGRKGEVGQARSRSYPPTPKQVLHVLHVHQSSMHQRTYCGPPPLRTPGTPINCLYVPSRLVVAHNYITTKRTVKPKQASTASHAPYIRTQRHARYVDGESSSNLPLKNSPSSTPPPLRSPVNATHSASADGWDTSLARPTRSCFSVIL